MLTRRNYLKIASVIMSRYLSGRNSSKASSNVTESLMMPDESHPHEQTWMSFVANDYIWSKQQIPEVKRNLALIAKTIARYEPVSVLVSPENYPEAVRILGNQGRHKHPVRLIKFTTDDLWLRDTAPTFVFDRSGKKYGIDFNFNGWGEKQEHLSDSRVARFITKQANAIVQRTDLILEGGCFEVDGHGTAILTRSCVLNKNRNPEMNQTQIEAELKALLGIKKVIWLEGIKGKDITDGHTDFYVRFARKGVVLASRDMDRNSYDYQVTRQNIKALKNATDADGNKLKVIVMDTPTTINEKFGVDDFAAGYIGYYLCNDAVILQSFGDKKADLAAKTILKKTFPERVIEQIAIDGIASGGGSIHCATQQEPKTPMRADRSRNIKSQ